MPDYEQWVQDALYALGGAADRVQVYRMVWTMHGDAMPEGVDEFYQWQHCCDLAAERLRSAGVLMPVYGRKDRPWTLVADPAAWVRRPPPQLNPTLF